MPPLADPMAVAFPPPGIHLVLGGARSGKSAYAEALITAAGAQAVYIATATAGDAEMTARIAAHRARRGAAWRTVEVPEALADALRREAAPARAILVDCLTLWLSNLMLAERDVAAASAELVHLLPALPGRVVLVANEVGLGIVPENALARAFRDAAGRLHQAVAAGLPLVLKETAA